MNLKGYVKCELLFKFSTEILTEETERKGGVSKPIHTGS